MNTKNQGFVQTSDYEQKQLCHDIDLTTTSFYVIYNMSFNAI